MDLIGPWTVQVRGNLYEFEALTAIDTMTNLVKIIRIYEKKIKDCSKKICTMLADALSVASELHT
jgi:hypothetical protein